MIQIKPQNLGIVGTATSVDITILSFTSTAKTCSAYWCLLTEEKKPIAEGAHVLSEAEFEAWGDDNAHVENIVLTHLKLERK